MKRIERNHPVFNTAILSAGTLLSKIMGFLREILIAAFFGASYLVDAYLVAMTIPQMLFSVIGGALTTTIIPLVTEYEETEGRESVLRFLNSVTTFIAVLVAIIILLGEIFTPFLVHLVAPGFQGEAGTLAVNLSRIMFPMMLFLGLAGLGTGILQSQKRFLYPAFIGIPYNIFIIGSLFLLGKHWGITGLAVGTLLGVVSQWVFQVPDLRRTGFPFRFRIDFSHPGFKKMGRLIIPVIIGTGAAQINLLVDRIMASGLVEGSISALNYATKLNLMIYAIIAVAIANAMYPEFAEAAVVQDTKKFLMSLVRSLNGLMLIILPVTVGMIILRVPLVRIVYERGAFDATATHLTVIALFFFAFGLPAMCLREIVLRAFYSLQDTVTPMAIGVATVGFNIILILLLVPYLDLGGLALATSISVTAGFLVLMGYLRRKLGHIGGKTIIVTWSKIMLASLLMGVAVFLCYSWLKTMIATGTKGDLFNFGVCVILGAFTYFLAVRLLHIEEADWVMAKVKTKLGW